MLNTEGAEKLAGMGDMLFLQPSTTQLLRLHGAYLSESEVGKVAKYLKRQGAPQFDEWVLREGKPVGVGGGMVDEADRELFEKACELAIQMGELSATLFQNRLRLGPARARRIVDYLDQLGLLGPVEAAKPRKVNVEKTMEILNKARSHGVLRA